MKCCWFGRGELQERVRGRAGARRPGGKGAVGPAAASGAPSSPHPPMSSGWLLLAVCVIGHQAPRRRLPNISPAAPRVSPPVTYPPTLCPCCRQSPRSSAWRCPCCASTSGAERRDGGHVPGRVSQFSSGSSREAQQLWEERRRPDALAAGPGQWSVFWQLR